MVCPSFSPSWFPARSPECANGTVAKTPHPLLQQTQLLHVTGPRFMDVKSVRPLCAEGDPRQDDLPPLVMVWNCSGWDYVVFPLHKITFKPLRYSFYQECRTCIFHFFFFFLFLHISKETALELRVTQQTWRYLNMKRCHNICNISHYRKKQNKKTCLYFISYKKVMEKFLKIGRNLCQIHVKCIKNTKPQHLTVKDALRLGIFK